MVLLLCLALAPSAMAYDQDGPQSQRPVLVGRISYVSGQLLRYVPEEKDWVATVKDSPFGLNDALYSGNDSKAEFIMPNGTWMRIGNNSQIQLIAAEADFTEADVSSGVIRFYNKSTDAVIKATTPFGYVLAPAETSFDLYVGDDSLEVIAMDGSVDFIPASGDAKYKVSAGGSSLLADSQQVSSGDGIVDRNWDAFNTERELIWGRRLHARSDSVTYLPESLHDEAYALDENGQWESVYYEGEYRRFWRPVRAGYGWAPFTRGHWTVWYEDNCWIPDEEFGYVTHHYGNWIYVGDYWYWAPPLARVDVAVAPDLFIGFGWYPGRVSWIYSGAYVGWVPLAPSERYYSHRYWGPRSYPVAHADVRNFRINRYSYYNHAVIVKQMNLYGVADYNSVRVRNINNINNFRAAPVVNNTVINNYNNITNKYNYTNTPLTRKPHESVTQRIRYNERAARQSANLTGKSVRQEAMRIKSASPDQHVKVENPMVSNKLVAPDAVRRQKSEMNFPQKEIKRERAINQAPVQLGQPAPDDGAGHPQPQMQKRHEVQPPFIKRQPPSSRQYGNEPQPPMQERPEVQPPSVKKWSPEPSIQHYPQARQPFSRQYRKAPQSPALKTRELQPPSVMEYAPETLPQRYPQKEQPFSQQRRKEPQQPSVQPQPNEPQAPMPRPLPMQHPSQQRQQFPRAPVGQRQQLEQPPFVQKYPQAEQPSVQPHPLAKQPVVHQQPQEQPQQQNQQPTPKKRSKNKPGEKPGPEYQER